MWPDLGSAIVGRMDIAMAVGHVTEATEDDRDLSARGLFVLELSNQPLKRMVGRRRPPTA